MESEEIIDARYIAEWARKKASGQFVRLEPEGKYDT